MINFWNREKEPSHTRSAAEQREIRRTLLNCIYCVVGLVLGFLYLKQNNPVGWVFVGGFTFFLLVQLSDPDDYEM